MEKDLTSQSYVSPARTEMPITKVSDAFFGIGALGNPSEVKEKMIEAKTNYDRFGATGINLVVSAKTSKAEAAVSNCYVGVESVDGVTMPRTIGFFDLMVFTAYCCIIDAGNSVCTAKQILRVMNGGKKSGIISSSESVRDVERSMDKMRFTQISFDWSEQAKAWGIELKGVKTVVKQTYMICAEKTVIKYVNGEENEGYRNLSYPALFQYAKVVKQVISIDNAILNINIRMSKKNMVIRDYLIRKIERLKYKKSRTSDVFRFETMIDRCQLAANNRTDIKRVRDAAYKILDCFVGIGYIKDYEAQKDATGKIVSVRLIV